MKFRTEIEKNDFNQKIEYSDPLFFLGSCFASSIGEECKNRGLATMINPFGATYNPISVVKIINHIDNCSPIEETMVREVNNKWCSLMHNSLFDAPTLPELIEKTEKTTVEAHNFLKKSSHLFITLGTAWVYIDKESVNIVNNCHKIDANQFIRRRLTVDEIVNNFSELFDNSKLLTDKKIIFTVSPIRHIKDTLTENSLSKALLRTAIALLCDKYGDRVSYFPSYEIMMDDLRDYRFYEADMIHPNRTAIEYIYSIFENSFFTKDCLDYTTKMRKVFSAREHRAIDPDGEAYRKFKKSMVDNILKIKSQYPNVEYDEWIRFFK